MCGEWSVKAFDAGKQKICYFNSPKTQFFTLSINFYKISHITLFTLQLKYYKIIHFSLFFFPHSPNGQTTQCWQPTPNYLTPCGRPTPNAGNSRITPTTYHRHQIHSIPWSHHHHTKSTITHNHTKTHNHHRSTTQTHRA
jgi:hypothetical protein